ncbi:ABC transporter permease [Clostridium beijerinckii]|nr:ABC transporter permease [Clostridium beijerinckii]MDG5854898.1 ABC transporter permease [Clostridium beijerinckii]NOV63541.1 ribose transport system permease protein [Clostridium beijerinckii]NOV73263.1 ribose transport system permease protein [Clostridium beijerinckii]NOW35401.1 ribose transport system permease protein [Clostridium beijerinckii]
MQFKKNNLKSTFENLQWNKYMVYIVFVVVFILFSITLSEKGFLSTNNLMNVLRQTAMISIMAVAGTFIIAAGQIDLTVGAVAAMSAMIVSLVLQSTNSIALALVCGLGFGLVIGAFNGFLVTKLRLPSFLATMGMMSAIRGTAMWVTDTAAVPIKNTTFTSIFGIGNVFGISVLILWTIVFYIIGIIVFNKTPFGRHVLATGGNELSAKYSGVKTQRIKLAIFIISGVVAAFAGILYAGRMQAGRFSFGDGDEMSVIAAVVLGGTAMSGGTGSVIGALVGSILMGVINNGLILGGLTSAQQTIVRGLIIVAAVALSNVTQGKKK